MIVINVKKNKISKETTQRKIVISNKTKTTSLMQYSNPAYGRKLEEPDQSVKIKALHLIGNIQQRKSVIKRESNLIRCLIILEMLPKAFKKV